MFALLLSYYLTLQTVRGSAIVAEHQPPDGASGVATKDLPPFLWASTGYGQSKPEKDYFVAGPRRHAISIGNLSCGTSYILLVLLSIQKHLDSCIAAIIELFTDTCVCETC